MWWWLHSSVYILKTITLYTLNGWIVYQQSSYKKSLKREIRNPSSLWWQCQPSKFPSVASLSFLLFSSSRSHTFLYQVLHSSSSFSCLFSPFLGLSHLRSSLYYYSMEKWILSLVIILNHQQKFRSSVHSIRTGSSITQLRMCFIVMNKII